MLYLRHSMAVMILMLPPVACASRLVAQDATKIVANDAKIVEKLKGDYVLRGGSVNGTKMTAERIANVSVKVTERTITTYDGQLQERFGASYTLLNDKQPWQVTLKSVKKISNGSGKATEKIEQSEGIIDVSEDGKLLKIAYAVDGGERPKDFKGGKQQNVFELERLSKSDKK